MSKQKSQKLPVLKYRLSKRNDNKLIVRFFSEI